MRPRVYTTPSLLGCAGAPRNSLILRWKPEALAAVRQAHDVYQREFVLRYGRTYRRISAYELVEGCSEVLCTAFATFVAHVMVSSRMFSSSSALFLGAWPAAANAKALQVSLHKLVREATIYLGNSSEPSFILTHGRRSYFNANRHVRW